MTQPRLCHESSPSEANDTEKVNDLRIVLVGKNGSENDQVEKFIHGREAFECEAPSGFSKQLSERNITVINTLLLQTDLSHQQIKQRVRECLSKSAPGPHVIILVLQYKDFSENDKQRVKYVLNLFSYQAIKHTIVVTTDDEPRGYKLTFMIWNNAIRDLIKECGERHCQFDTRNPEWYFQMLRSTENMLKEEHEEFLICNMYEDDGTSVDEDPESSDQIWGRKTHQSTKTASDGGVATSGKSKLNIVLCGNNPTLKNSVSKMFRGVTSKPREEMNKVCQKREGTIHGRQISVIELPALTRLSEEEVMYMRAPEKKVRHEVEEKLRVRDNEIKELQQKIKALESVKLNLVLCGNEGLKSFTSNLILNQSEKGSVLGSECVRRDVELHGRLISLVELPVLTRLSEEEVMRQTHRCVSVCHPGVHVFIIIIPDAPLNNEDKAEMEKIQRVFSSRINKHVMILIKQNPEHQTEKLNEETQSVIESFGGRHHFIDLNTQVSVLMEKLEQVVEENSGVCFSTETLFEAQMEKLLKFEEMKRRIRSLETLFQPQGNDLKI
ncbi:GTPase IMAP family member 8-like protein [Labeo rohita]|uniref:GTPase IMAP family member 8-like protein n=1 Tax=Labeo rohita TaxID=84645 RepID=A0A498LVQ4_LABRO|nr:GTPase IMAP family member 8-like protein [Labeo rohita]